MDKKSKKKFYCKNLNVKNKRQEDLTGNLKNLVKSYVKKY